MLPGVYPLLAGVGAGIELAGAGEALSSETLAVEKSGDSAAGGANAVPPLALNASLASGVTGEPKSGDWTVGGAIAAVALTLAVPASTGNVNPEVGAEVGAAVAGAFATFPGLV